MAHSLKRGTRLRQGEIYVYWTDSIGLHQTVSGRRAMESYGASLGSLGKSGRSYGLDVDGTGIPGLKEYAERYPADYLVQRPEDSEVTKKERKVLQKLFLENDFPGLKLPRGWRSKFPEKKATAQEPLILPVDLSTYAGLYKNPLYSPGTSIAAIYSDASAPKNDPLDPLIEWGKNKMLGSGTFLGDNVTSVARTTGYVTTTSVFTLAGGNRDFTTTRQVGETDRGEASRISETIRGYYANQGIVLEQGDLYAIQCAVLDAVPATSPFRKNTPGISVK